MIGITIGRPPHDHGQNSLHDVPVRPLTNLILLKKLFNIQSAGMLRRKNQDQNQNHDAETWHIKFQQQVFTLSSIGLAGWRHNPRICLVCIQLTCSQPLDISLYTTLTHHETNTNLAEI